jgi:hypothetical protein
MSEYRLKTVNKCSEETGLKVYLIRRLCKENKIKYMVCGRKFYVDLDSLDAYIRGEINDRKEN